MAVRLPRRLALDVTVPVAQIRIVNTHLEFHSAAQREAQIMRLLRFAGRGLYKSSARRWQDCGTIRSPVVAASSVPCGDFNFDVSDPQHRMLNASSRAGLNYRDAWAICHPGRPRDPTCGVRDRIQWDGPDCRDCVFVTGEVAGRVR
jgi:endonuclease/exonuclease/phosphatase family metal-dependent hydrolase